MADMASTTTAHAVEPGVPTPQSGTVLLTGGNNVKPWADTPYTLIGDTKAADPSHAHIPAKHYCKEMAYTMAQIHNTVLRGVNSIYKQAANVKPGTQDCADFLFYNQCVYDFLHHHHMNEEESFFPLLRDLTGDATFCDVATKEHDLFDVGVGKWKEYIYNVNPEEYDGSRLKEIIEGFGTHLHQHLTAEIAWLLSMSKYDSDACKKAFLTTGKKAEAELTFQKCVFPGLDLADGIVSTS